ncbi:MAG: gluconokinase [Polaromonas sp.]|nr:gluconokinase [Polaromonas sp.]
MPQIVVIMGVSGCGKSAVATGVARQFGWRAVDADDLHTPEAVAKMRAGQGLSDDDRAPWLDRVGALLAAGCAAQVGLLVACSALRRSYRDRLRTACPSVQFLFLDGDRAVIETRMAQRRDHYMPTSLLESQLRTLERPAPDETDVMRVNIDQPLDTLVQQACAALRHADVSADR